MAKNMSALEEEFKTVDLVLGSVSETRGVDAFCLAWVKFERQLRKLTANILYQSSEFPESDTVAKEALREALSGKKTSNYERFLSAIRRLTNQDAKSMLAERSEYLWHSMKVGHERRNKILHGLQTGQSLDRDQLVKQVMDIKEVCQLVAAQANERFGYDGLTRDSLQKNQRPDITIVVDEATLDGGWKSFVAHRL
jgi:hypothetical protein